MWNDGFTGITLKLEKDGNELRGWAHTHFDGGVLLPRIAHVIAQRIGCDAATDGKAPVESPDHSK